LYISGCPDPLVIANGSEFTLGRIIQPDCYGVVDLSLYRAYVLGVSRQHAMITRTSAGYTIRDLGSANGTWLNGVRLEGYVPYLLTDGDQIQLGRLSITLRFMIGETISH